MNGLGLPVILTLVDQGTALDIAGQGQANSSSLFEAVMLAQKKWPIHFDFFLIVRQL